MERIVVERLRVGLWVSMEDVPGTGFMLRSDAQIATFAELGVSHVWHEPARSEVAPLPEPSLVASRSEGLPSDVLPSDAAGSSAGGRVEVVAVADAERLEGAAAERGPRVSAFDDDTATAPPSDALDAQRQSLDRCERRFSAVSKAFRNVLQNVRAQPEEARAIAETEIGGMVRTMKQEQDVAIRLLSEKAG